MHMKQEHLSPTADNTILEEIVGNDWRVKHQGAAVARLWMPCVVVRRKGRYNVPRWNEIHQARNVLARADG